jgi:hypothetical protein
MIWHLFVEQPRVIQLRVKNPPTSWSSHAGRHAYLEYLNTTSDTVPSKVHVITTIPTAIPLLLHICQESRCYGLTIYSKLSLGGYFNFNLDTLLISPDVFPVLGATDDAQPDFTLLSESESRSLQHIAFYFPRIRRREDAADRVAHNELWFQRLIYCCRGVR